MPTPLPPEPTAGSEADTLLALQRRNFELEQQLQQKEAERQQSEARLNALLNSAIAVEEALQQSHQQVRDILTSISDAFFSVDRNWQFTFLNQQAEHLLRHNAQELLNRNIWEAFPDTVGSTFYHQYHWSMAHQQSVAFEAYYAPFELWVEVRAYPFEAGLSVYMQDISERVRLDDERRKVEWQAQRLNDRLQSLLSNAPVALFTCKPSGNYRTTFISDNIRAIAGYEPQAFLDDPHFWASRIHPDDAPQVFGDLSTLFEHDHHEHEYRFLHQNGSYCWIHNDLRLIRNANGDPIEIVGYFADISDRVQAAWEHAKLFQQLQFELEERQRAEASLQQLNQQLEQRVQERTQQLQQSQLSLQQREQEIRALVENSPDIIARFDPDLQFLYINQAIARITGLQPKDLIGRRLTEVDLPATCIIRCEAAIHRAFQTETEQIIELELPASTELRWLKIRFVPERTLSGKVITLLSIAEEITDRKQAEAQIQLALQEKETLLKEIHHRVKNNLQIISALLSFQADRVQDSQTFAVLQDSESRLQAMSLIHETLYQSENLGQLNFSNYIQRLAENIVLANTIQFSTIQLSYQLDPIYLNLETAIPCGLLLNELITNAVKHAFPHPSRGLIHITLEQVNSSPEASQNEPQYKLKVQDNGIGIPILPNPQHLQSLGLRIAYDLAQQLKGTLELDSKVGTTFQLTFSELRYRKRF